MTSRDPNAPGDSPTILIVAAFWLFVAIVCGVVVIASLIGRGVTP